MPLSFGLNFFLTSLFRMPLLQSNEKRFTQRKMEPRKDQDLKLTAPKDKKKARKMPRKKKEKEKDIVTRLIDSIYDEDSYVV